VKNEKKYLSSLKFKVTLEVLKEKKDLIKACQHLWRTSKSDK